MCFSLCVADTKKQLQRGDLCIMFRSQYFSGLRNRKSHVPASWRPEPGVPKSVVRTLRCALANVENRKVDFVIGSLARDSVVFLRASYFQLRPEGPFGREPKSNF